MFLKRPTTPISGKKYFPPQFIEYIKSLTPVKLQQFKQSFPKDKWFGLFDIKRKTLVQMYSVGLGLSQVIPLTVCMARHKNGTLLFEQPELHLHPKQQAAVGDLLIRAVKQSRSHIIAETHSVHLILRILRRIRETQNEENVIAEFTQDDLSVQYVDFESGRTTFTEMEVGNDGLFLTDWPDSFFEQEFMERFGL
jgi:predicted ATPase